MTFSLLGEVVDRCGAEAVRQELAGIVDVPVGGGTSEAYCLRYYGLRRALRWQ